MSRRSLLIGAAGAVVVVGGGAAGADYEIHRHPTWRTRLFGCGTTPSIPHSDYVVTSGTYPSQAMHSDVPWFVALPKSASTAPSPLGFRPPLVVVLPGVGATAATLINGIGLPGWATASGIRGLAFACPGGGDHTYYHPRADGTNSFAWVTDEFIPMVEQRFGVGGARARRAAFGYSMGGYGALLVAAKRPDLACAAVASSPAVFPTYQDAVAGHPYTFDSEADWERWGLWQQLQTVDGTPVRIDCGDADPFASTARQLLTRIPNAIGGISHGCHDEAFWRTVAPAQLRFLAAHLSS